MKTPDEITILHLITNKKELKELIAEVLKEALPDILATMPLPTPPEPDKLHTIQAAAVFFGVSTTTIHSWKNQGILPYLKIGSRIRFKHSDLLNLNLERQK